ncbi:ATP-binding cassette sub-family G member 2 [Cynoglossus semilaevis]|nr:ATP-binding cassette sub-family G member 2 [Cynoglossus semilaevis]
MKSNLFRWKSPSTKKILADLSGIMKPGINAILGPSGSGKSTFLDVLAARKDPSGLSGEVLINGAPQPENFKHLCGYVVQGEVIMGTLTVRENLCFSAALRLPSSLPQSEKMARVGLLIDELGLTNVADSKVGTEMIRGISGGEKKRTMIGMELINEPAVLFLDEPTSGLDAATANSVLELLRRMANNGKTIILSIHQPRYSIYRFFDSLTLLVSGNMVYHGPAQNALDYFASIGYCCEPHNNPADFFLDVIHGNYIGPAMTKDQCSEDGQQLSGSRQSVEEHLIEEYRRCSYYSDRQVDLERIVKKKEFISCLKSHSRSPYNSSFCQQLNSVLKRTFKNILINPQSFVSEVTISILLALIVGAIFFGVKDDQSGIQNRMGAIFFITTNQCFATISSAELFIAERKLFVHEYISGYYRASVYFLSKVLAEILLRSITSTIFCCIVYFVIGLKFTTAAFLIFVLTVTLMTCTASAMNMAISANQTVVAVATIYMTLCFILMMIFSGLLVYLPGVVSWLAWLKYLSIPRYGTAALNVNEFVGLKFCDEALIQGFNKSVNLTDCSVNTNNLICTGEQHLQYLEVDYSSWGLWQNHVALILMSSIFFTISYLKLRYIKKFT